MGKRKLTAEELQGLQQAGYDITPVIDKIVDLPDAPTSALAAGGRSALASVAPTVAGGAAFMPGFTAGAGIGAAIPGLDVTGIPELVGGLIGGAISSGAVQAGTGWLQGKLLPEAAKQQLAEDYTQHPTATTVGSLATLPLGGLSPSPRNLVRAAGAIPQLLAGSATKEGIQALGTVAGGAVLGAGQEAAMEKLRGEDLSAGEIAKQAAIGSIFNKPNIIGTRFMGFHPQVDRTIANPSALAATLRPAEGQVVDAAPPAEPKPLADYTVEKFPKPFDVHKVLNNLRMQPSDEPMPITELNDMVQKQMSAKGLSTKITPDYVKAMGDWMESNGINLKQDGTLTDLEGKPVKGIWYGGENKIAYNASINPDTGFPRASVDTIPHEYGGHDIWNRLTSEQRKQYEIQSKSELEAINKAREEANKSRSADTQLSKLDVEEHFAGQQGLEFMKQQLNLEGETPFNKWWNDTKALWKQKYGSEPSLEDLRRAYNFRAVNDNRNIRPVVTGVGIKHNQPEDSGLMDFDKLKKSIEEDIKRKQEIGVNTEEDEKMYDKLFHLDTKLSIPNERNQPEGSGLQEEKPWEQLGISRREYYYRKAEEKAGQLPFNHNLNTPLAQRAYVGNPTVIHETDIPRMKKIVSAVVAKTVNRQMMDKLPSGIDNDAILNDVATDIVKNGIDQGENGGFEKTVWRRADNALKKILRETFKGQKDVRLDKTIEEGGKSTLENIADTEAGTPSEEAIQHEEMPAGSTTVAQLIDRLTPMEGHPIVNKILDELHEMAPDKQVDVGELADKYGLKFQKEEEGLQPDKNIFTTKAVKILQAGQKVWNGGQLIGAFKNQLSPTEYAVLKDAGIEQELAGKYVSKEDALKWVKENQPKVEVRKFGVSKVKSGEFYELHHGIYDSLTAEGKSRLDRVIEGRPLKDFIDWTGVAIDAPVNKNYIQKLERYVELAKQRANEPKVESSHWQSIAPKSEQDMPGYVEIAVVKPVKQGVTIKEHPAYDKDAGAQFPSSHSFPPNTLGFVRGYMEGDTFHVIEVQSDWAQRQRNEAQRQPAPEMGQDNPFRSVELAPGKTIKESGDPLLSHYERLALKAAIEHARQEGATKIAISDAETAMMTEGHDRGHVAQMGDAHTMEFDNEAAARKEYEWQKDMNTDGLINLEHKGDKWLVRYAPPQEPGMRLHYDKILQKIAEELTGSKGEKVSFGGHKEAFLKEQAPPESITELWRQGKQEEYRKALDEWNKQKHPRKDLIFRNPDSTPKTDVSALSYPLEKVSKRISEGDLFTLFNKHQPEGEGLKPVEGDTIDITKKGFLRPLEASFDRVERVSTRLAQAFRNWQSRRDEFIGLRNVAVNDLKQFPQEEVNRVMALHRRFYRNGEELPALSGRDKQISDILQNYYGKIGDIRRESGMLIDGREPGKNSLYVPDQLSDHILSLLTEKAGSPEAIQAERAWANHIVKTSKGVVPMEEAKDYVTAYTEALGGKQNNYLSVNFGAIRKAAGYGLPEGLRETDAVKSLYKYGQRAASDLAMFMELERRPEIAAALKLRDPNTGNIATAPGVDALNTRPEVRNAMKWVTNDLSHAGQMPRTTAVIRFVNNLLLGPATGLRDTVSVPMNMIPYINRWEDLGAAVKGAFELRNNARKALETAARQPSIDRLQFGDLLDAPDRFTAIMNKAAVLARKWQGREAIENFNRNLTFSIGRELGRSNIIGAQAGDKTALEFLKKFGTLIPDNVLRLSGAELESALDKIGKNFTDRNQGSYGGAGLPTGIMDSQFAPFYALQKWSVEKSNVIYKDVVKPALDGENYLPLLTYTLGAFVTGAAIQELNKVLTGRKAQDPELKEAFAEGSAKNIVGELATIMQLGSFAGIVGDGMKFASDVGLYGKAPRNIVSFPTATAAIDMQERVTDVVEAIRNGEDSWSVIKQLSLDAMTHNIQAIRMAANRTVNESYVEKSDKMRDVRVYNQLEGKPASDLTPPPNRYLNMDVKQFKRTGDISEAAQLAPQLFRRALDRGQGNIEDIRSNVRGLGINNYQTMPSLEKMPISFINYYNFLARTQGKEAADARLQDYIRQTTINKIKSGMIPRF